MALNSVYRVRSIGTLFGAHVEFGVHIQQVTASGGPDDLAGSWVTEILPAILAATSSAVNWLLIRVSDVSPTGDESVDLPITQPAPGAITGDCLPANNAACVRLRSGQKGQRRRGRFFVPGLSESFVANGVVSGAQGTALAALGQAIINTYGPAGTETNYRVCVHSPEKLTAPPPRPFVPRAGTLTTFVTTADLDETVRSQRRRVAGSGI